MRVGRAFYYYMDMVSVGVRLCDCDTWRSTSSTSHTTEDQREAHTILFYNRSHTHKHTSTSASKPEKSEVGNKNENGREKNRELLTTRIQ